MATGWPVLEDYKAWARIGDNIDDAAIERALAAAVRHVEETATLIEADDPAPADLTEAVLLLTNRLLARRNSPEGVLSIADGTVVTVGRFDPDITRLLGPHTAAKLA